MDIGMYGPLRDMIYDEITSVIDPESIQSFVNEVGYTISENAHYVVAPLAALAGAYVLCSLLSRHAESMHMAGVNGRKPRKLFRL